MIPFNRPAVVGREYEYIQDAVERGHISGIGHYTKLTEQLLSDMHGGGKRVFLTTSCTHALEMAALLLDLGEGDEVILPSFTFVSTANAFLLRGATLIYADVEPQSMNLDLDDVEAKITERTKVVVPVHYGGVSCDMDRLMAMCDARDIVVVEDAAQSMGSSFNGKKLGTFGALACISFHETKNVYCGEGGALVVNDTQYADHAEIIREKGTNRSKFYRGQVDKYTWVEKGSSYVLSDMLAAFLCGQLEKLFVVTKRRCEIVARYTEAFASFIDSGFIQVQQPVLGNEGNGHIFYMIMPTAEMRDRFIRDMREHGVFTTFHYVPLHTSPMGGMTVGTLPITEEYSDRLVRLPVFWSLKEAELLGIISGVQACLERYSKE